MSEEVKNEVAVNEATPATEETTVDAIAEKIKTIVPEDVKHDINEFKNSEEMRKMDYNINTLIQRYDLGGIDLAEEYNLIQKKASKLSAMKRKIVTQLISIRKLQMLTMRAVNEQLTAQKKAEEVVEAAATATESVPETIEQKVAGA